MVYMVPYKGFLYKIFALKPEFGKMLWFGVLRLGNFGAQEVFDIFLFQIKIVKL